MNAARVRVLVAKEFEELSRSKTLILSLVLPPLLFLVVPFFIAVAVQAFAGDRILQDQKFEQMLQASIKFSPQLALLTKKAQAQVMWFRQFLLFLLIAPVMGSMSIATYSIIGEKVNRSLEPLLATPITTLELLFGKCVASGLPAILASWVSFALYAFGIRQLAAEGVFTHVINLTGLFIMLLISPLIALLGLSVGVIVSARSRDPRSAQQVGVLLILPVIGTFVGQLFGLFFLTPAIVLGGAAALAVADLIVLRLGSSIFQRESILTRWK